MKTVPASAFKNPIHLLAIGLGSGAAARAPGTWGTLAAMLLYLPLSQLDNTAYFVVLVIATLAGFYICDKTSRDWGVHDHKAIVWDEFVGYWITMFLIPTTWYWMLIGFALFRLFDIWKPWPIRYLDRHVKGGIGIMVDDIAAGVVAWGVLYTITLIFPSGMFGSG